MAKRKIINIDAEKCDGCGLCISNCPEGAIRIIDNKARLINDLFCDGLGACIGHCPRGAIVIEERDAGEYDECKVTANIVKQGKNVIKEPKRDKYFKQAIDEARHSGCPGLKVMDFRQGVSELRQWPVKITLVPPFAPYLEGADLLIAADCVPFAYAYFHRDLLKGKTLLIGCPKLDDSESYQGKINEILKNNNIKSITYAHMEVACCFGLVRVIKSAIALSSKVIPFKEITISINGEILE